MHAGAPCTPKWLSTVARGRSPNCIQFKRCYEVPIRISSQATCYRNTQTQAAHAHSHPSASLPDIGISSTSSPSSFFKRLVPNYDQSFGLAQDGPASAQLDTGGSSDGSAPLLSSASHALLRRLHATWDRMGSSLAQLLVDGAAEDWSAWDISKLASSLLTLGLLRHKPDHGWLKQYWSASYAKLHDCTATDLELLSIALNELQLKPPRAWLRALLSVTMKLAEREAGLPKDAEAAASAMAAAGHGAGADDLQCDAANGTAGDTGSSSGVASLLLAPARLLWGRMWQASATASDGWRRGRMGSQLLTLLYSLVVAGLPLQPIWVSRFLEAMRPRLGGLSGGDLHNMLTAMAWVAARSRTGTPIPYSGDGDWEEFSGGCDSGYEDGYEESCGEEDCALAVSPAWLVALYARMDAVNWALQGEHLVGCLRSIASLGLRAPPQWVRRQMLSLQPCLPLLATQDLVQLAAVLPALLLLPAPLQPSPQPLPKLDLAVAATTPVTAASVPPAAAAAESSSSRKRSGGGFSLDLQSHLQAQQQHQHRWLGPWMAEYRSVVSERRDAMKAAELLTVLVGVDAMTAAAACTSAVPVAALPQAEEKLAASSPAPSAPDATARTGAAAVGDLGQPHVEWRGSMVAAVTEELQKTGLEELCEAWRALASAHAGAMMEDGGDVLSQEQRQRVAKEQQAEGAATAVDGLGCLRTLVADRLAASHTELSAAKLATVLSALAASRRPLPAATLDALLAASQPLLPEVPRSDLVSVLHSLVRLSHKPNLGWQTAFFSTTRPQLFFMPQKQRCLLLVASASLGMHVPDVWMDNFFFTSEGDLHIQCRMKDAVEEQGVQVLGGRDLAGVLYAASCMVSEAPESWLRCWERASMGELRHLAPDMLAMVIKAMSTLHHKPSQAWLGAFYGALKGCLFAAEGVQLPSWTYGGCDTATSACVPTLASALGAITTGTAALGSSGLTNSSDAAETTSHLHSHSAAVGSSSSRHATVTNPTVSTTASPGSSIPEPGSGSTSAWGLTAASYSGSESESCFYPNMLSCSLSAETLTSLVYSLASLDLSPPPELLDELMDAVQCRLSLLSTLDLSVVLAFLVAREHRPGDEWWESFLEALEGRFGSLSGSELSSLLVMLHSLRVSPAAQWLDAFCATTQPRLSFFHPTQLLQVLSCMHLFRHRPSQSWLACFAAAVEQQLPRLSPTELARVLMLLDHLNQRPSPAFMLRFFDVSRPGLRLLESQELVNVAWAVVSCSVVHPDYRWTDALVEAARPRLASLQPPQLRVLVAALGHMQRNVPTSTAEDFLAFAREFLV